jgi:hypothetical protein
MVTGWSVIGYKQVDRCPDIHAFTNFVPTNFTPAVRARAVLAAPLARVAGARLAMGECVMWTARTAAC